MELSFERRGGPAGVSRVDLELAGIATFTGVTPVYVNADTPCSAGLEGTLSELRRTVPLDVAVPGRTPLAAVDVPAGSDLREIWLVLVQGTLFRGGRPYKVHANGDHMCKMPDGQQYILVRVLPGSVSTAGGADYTLVLPFDAREQVVETHVDCDASPEVDECGAPDDPEDDPASANTRLRYAFQRAFPVTVEPVR
jgi:hypothetical protein